jgi:hypothetical protein
VENPDRLPHLLHPAQIPVVAVAVLADRDLEIVGLVVVVRAVLPQVVRHTGRPEVRPRETVVDGFVRTDRSDPLRPPDVNLVAGQEAVDLVEGLREVLQEVQKLVEPSIR